MAQQNRFFIRSIKTIALFSVLSLVSCTSKNSSIAVEPVGNVQSDSLSDTSTSTPATVDNSNLFDTTTTNDIVPTVTTTGGGLQSVPVVPYTQTSQYCLNGTQYTIQQTQTTSTNTNSNQPYWYGQQPTATAGLSTACVDPSYSQNISQDQMLNWGIQSFNSMQSCYELVMARAPQYCSQGTDASMIFKMSRMALTRCFRQILRQQMAQVRWAPEQTQSFQSTDASMYLILSMFGQE